MILFLELSNLPKLTFFVCLICHIALYHVAVLEMTKEQFCNITIILFILSVFFYSVTN